MKICEGVTKMNPVSSDLCGNSLNGKRTNRLKNILPLNETALAERPSGK